MVTGRAGACVVWKDAMDGAVGADRGTHVCVCVHEHAPKGKFFLWATGAKEVAPQ